MPIATRTFRVFVSSPFEDLTQERDALQREVFPSLAALCRSRGARFQAIDLRWGVRDEAAIDQQTMEICLAEVERCQRTGVKPNFIVLLGSRYGWRPLPARINALEFETVRANITDSGDRSLVQEWYRRDDNAVPPVYLLRPRTGAYVDADHWRDTEQRLRRALTAAAAAAGLPGEARVKFEASATHQEILKGLGRTEDDRRHVFAFMRSGGRLDEDSDLVRLKAWLRGHLGGNAVDYAVGDLTGLCSEVTRRLETAIVSESSGFEDRSALEMENEAHHAFAVGRARHFVGRAGVLDEIASYLDQGEPRPFVLQGASGVGKSAVMAQASTLAAARHARAVVICRFIGASPRSSDLLTLLQDLCHQISREYGGPVDAPEATDALAHALRERLTMARPDRPLIVFIDALEQLAPLDSAASPSWVPHDLPPFCRVVVSNNGPSQSLQGCPHTTIPPMTTAEADDALSLWLEDAGRTLLPVQRAHVIESARASGLPLHLKLAFEEALRWRSFDPPDACVLGTSVDGMVDVLVRRLIVNHGPVLLERCIGYLIAARYGLTEDEVLDVLSADEAVWADFTSHAHFNPPERRLPVILWSRLFLDLAFYLTERSVPGGTVVTFFQRQLAGRFAAALLPDDHAAYHHSLADYFHRQAHWLGGGIPNTRKLTELVRQQVGAALEDDLAASLTDVEFIGAKSAGGLVLDLQEDYRSALRAFDGTDEPPREHADADRLARWSRDLMGYARAWSDRRDRISAGDVVDAASPSPPAAPACCPMWTDAEIEAEGRRIREAPSRRDRLTAFSSFVHRESHALLRFGTREAFVVQHAFNDAPGGPVHDAASAMVPHVRAPLLLRRWPGTTWEPHPAILRTLTGHTDSVSSVSASADGMRAISSSADTSLRLWDLRTGACLRVLSTSRSQGSVCLTADGQRALSAGPIHSDGQNALELWDLERGSCIRTLDGHATLRGFSEVVAAMTADGRRALSASNRDATMVLWDLDRGVRARLLEGHVQGVTAISVTPDGRRAISAGSDDTLRLWDLDDGRCLRSMQASRVTSVSLTADGGLAISASLDHTLQVWDADNGHLLRLLTGHADGIASVTVTADGRRAISCGVDKTLRVWDVETGVCLRILEGCDERALAVTADGRRALTSAAGNTLRLWDLERGASPRARERHTAAITDVSMAPQGWRAVSASTDGTLRVWDLETATSVRRLDGHGGAVKSVSVTADGRCAVSASADDTLRVWDLDSGAALRIVPGFRASSERVRGVTPDGRYAVSAGMDDQSSKDQAPRVWDLDSGAAMRVLQRGAWPLCVWNLEQGTRLRTLEAHAGPVTSVSMSADGRRAVSGSWDETVRLWDLQTGACLRTLKGHTGWITGVSLMDECRRAITASHDQTVRVWHLESGACLFTLHSHRAKVTSVKPLADGLRAVSVGDDGELRVWDINRGERLQSFKGHGSGSFELKVTESGLCVCTTSLSRDRTIWVQSLESGDEAVLSATDPISAVAVASGVLVAGTPHGEIQVFEPKNFARAAVPAKVGEADHEQLLRRRVEMARHRNDREAYFGHLVDLGMYLEDTGRAEEALAVAREGEIALGEYLLGLQWANPRVALEQYTLAVHLRSSGRPEESEPHLRRVLDIERQVLPPDSPLLPHHMNELCTVLVMQGMLPESTSLAADAWNLQRGRHDMTSARILFVRLAIAMLERQPTGLYIGLLKTLLAGPTLDVAPGITRFWDIESFLHDVGAKLTEPERELLVALEKRLNSPPEPVFHIYGPGHTLETVLDSRRLVSQLDRHEAWTVQPAVPLDAPWASRRPGRDWGI